MPTLTQFKDVHMAGIEADLHAGGPWGFLNAHIDRSRGHISFRDGSFVKPFPASEYNSRTARGMRCDILSSDECDDIEPSIYDAIATPWLSEPWSLGIELLGGTPTRGRHGLWWRALQAGRLGARLRSRGDLTDAALLELPEVQEIVARFDDTTDPAIIANAVRSTYSFHATYRDTPETVSPQAVAKARANTPPATFQREWEADPDAGEGLVYPFDEEIHVRIAPDPSKKGIYSEFHVGVDFGFNDAGVMILFGIQGHGDDAVVWALNEHYETGVTNDVWDQRAKAWRYAKFWPDPSRPERAADFRGMGLDVGKVDNEIFGGIARVANLLFLRPGEDGKDRARFYVDPRCRNLIREFGLYRRKKQPDGSFGEKPEDRHNHAMDAARYAMVGRFGKPLNTRYETR